MKGASTEEAICSSCITLSLMIGHSGLQLTRQPSIFHLVIYVNKLDHLRSLQLQLLSLMLLFHLRSLEVAEC